MGVEATQTDTYLSCLEAACRVLGVRHHRAEILAGLPLSEGGLDIELLTRAAANVGLEVQAVDGLPLADVALPALARREQGTPLLLMQRSGADFLVGEVDELGNWRETKVTTDTLVASLQARLSSLSCAEHTDGRSDSLLPRRPVHWLRAAIDEVRPWYRDVLVASIVVNFLGLVVPLFTMNVYDRVVPNLAFNTLWVLAGGVVIALLFDWLLRQARTHLADMAGRKIDVNVSSRLFGRVMGMQLEHRPQSSGAFAKQVQEFDTVRDFLTSATLVTAIDLPFTLLFLGLIAWLGGWLVLIPLSAMVLVLAAGFYHHKQLAQQLEHTARLSTQRQAQLVESLHLLGEAKQQNAEGLLQRRWENTVSALSDYQIKVRSLSNRLSHTVLLSQQAVVTSLIIGGVYSIAAGSLSMGGLIALVMLSGRASNSINQLAMLMLRYEQCKSAVKGLDAVVQLPQERRGGRSVQATSFEGHVELRDLSFSYPQQNLPVLEGLRAKIAPGERVALVGPPGAGKSTLLALLASQYQSSASQLFYDNVDSQLWNPAELRDAIAWVPQQPQLLFGSLLENIALGMDSVSQEKLSRVLKQSGIDRFMDRLENGLETSVGEMGRNLSGGQRQAVIIARALLRKPTLLLLDEPTSAMDQRSENQIAAALKALSPETGFVMATHRAPLVMACQRVIAMDRGRIIIDQSYEQYRAGNSARVQTVPTGGAS